MNRTLFLTAIMAASAWGATTYTFTGSNYTVLSNFAGGCPAGTPCANYTGAMSISGSFTLAAALPANFSLQDITSQLVTYSFSDGLSTFTNSDPNTRVDSFQVSTDGTGHISNTTIELLLWQTGSSPHMSGNRLAIVQLAGAVANGGSTNNATCTLIGTGSSGVADTCTGISGGFGTGSSSASSTGGSWSGGGSSGPPPTGVPTLGEWGTILLTGLLAVFAWLRLRGQQRPTPSA